MAHYHSWAVVVGEEDPRQMREEEVVAVRVAWLMVVLREIGMPVPEALAAVPAGVTRTGTEVVLLDGCYKVFMNETRLNSLTWRWERGWQRQTRCWRWSWHPGRRRDRRS